jgi:mono/diheme cytochrome c family protein
MKALALLAATALGGLAAGAAALYSGVYDVSATGQHTAPVYWLIEIGMRRSVQRAAAPVEVPPLDDPARRARGLALFREHCVACHGAPGVPPERFALGLTPSAANLAHTARDWPPGELFWVVKYGIKMTGMPAWTFRLTDEDIWAVVAFLEELPRLSPADYRARNAAPATQATAPPLGPPDPARGRVAILQYACVTCHRIPGVVGASAPVGPPLDGIGTRQFLAGALPNTPDNMVRWLRTPQAVNPLSAMPDLGLSERDARDIAAYLATLERP